jgi:hypothetical protein
MTVSSGGKIVIVFGAFLMLGAAFITSNPLIAIVVFIMGIVAMAGGYAMKQGPAVAATSRSIGTPQSGNSHYNTGHTKDKYTT